MSKILWVVTVSGMKEAGEKVAEKLDAEVVDVAKLLEIHKQREQYAVAENDPYDNSTSTNDPKFHSQGLWEKYNWGIHSAALQSDGCVFRSKFMECPEDNIDLLLFLRLLSADHSDLFFDVVGVKDDEDMAIILLFHGGEAALFSFISDEDFDVFHDVYAQIGESMRLEVDEQLTDPADIKEKNFENGLTLL